MPKIKVAELKLFVTKERGERIIIRDTEGRLWQRFDDMPDGAWGEFALPDEPRVDTSAPVQQPRKKRAAKR